jgi:hypothetical protein
MMNSKGYEKKLSSINRYIISELACTDWVEPRQTSVKIFESGPRFETGTIRKKGQGCKRLGQLAGCMGTYLQTLRKDIFATRLKASSNVMHFNYVAQHNKQTK